MRVVRSLLEGFRGILIELRAVRSLLVEWRGNDRVGSCMEKLRRNVRYLIELRVISSLLEGFRCIQFS